MTPDDVRLAVPGEHVNHAEIVGSVAELSQAHRMLADARTVADFRDLRDFATSMKAWAQSRHLGVAAENEAAVVILRAERGAGRELLRMAEDGERARRGDPTGLPRDKRGRIASGPTECLVTLRSMGIPMSSAANWQRLAEPSDEHFERMLTEAREPDDNGLVKRIAKKRFYPWPEDRRDYSNGANYRRDDPLTPLFHLQTYASQVLGASLERLSSDDLVSIGKLGVRLVKAARAEMDRRGL